MTKNIFSFLGLVFACFWMACGNKPESDIVGYGVKDFSYNFDSNPAYNSDSMHSNTKATLSLYSTLADHTQFTLSLNRIKPGTTYISSLYNVDSTKPGYMADSPAFSFPAIVAVDTAELAYTPLLVGWNLDSFVQKYQGYLVVHQSNATSLADSNLIIKGRIGK